jgi:hypothetical protein
MSSIDEIIDDLVKYHDDGTYKFHMFKDDIYDEYREKTESELREEHKRIYGDVS